MKNMYTITSEIINGKEGKLQYTAYCPVITKPENGAMRTVNNFSRHACGEFIKYAREISKIMTEENSIVRCFQLMYSSRFIVSFKYEMQLFDEKLMPYNQISGAVWNAYCGSGVALKEFFRGNVRYKEMILYILSGKVKEKAAKGEVFCSGWNERLYAAWEGMGYYLCPEGFVFLMPKNTVKAEENRTTEIFIPFAELKNQLGGRLLT